VHRSLGKFPFFFLSVFSLLCRRRCRLCRALILLLLLLFKPANKLLFPCSRPPLPFLPSSASSNRTTACHDRRRPCSPWAAIISPSLLSSTPCRASPLPTGAPRPHPGANPSPDRPTDVHRRPSSAAASASPSTRPSSSSHPLPITLAGLHHLEEAPGPPYRASSTLNMPKHRHHDKARSLPPEAELRGRPASDHPSSTRTLPEVHLYFLVLLHPWPLAAGDSLRRNAAASFLSSVFPNQGPDCFNLENSRVFSVKFPEPSLFQISELLNSI
jgi:hypothetical protein